MFDSIDKIMTYFSAVCTESFKYKRKTYIPKDLRVSTHIFRGVDCVVNCGACCKRYSLDYLPSEKHPYELEKRLIQIGSTKFTIYSDLQPEAHDNCSHLDMSTGRCKIYPNRAFSCDFELIRFLHTNIPNKPTQLLTKLYGRKWNMTRCDGGLGGLCKILPCSIEIKNDIIRKFTRLKEWADYFKIPTCLPEIITYINTGPHPEPFVLNISKKEEITNTWFVKGA